MAASRVGHSRVAVAHDGSAQPSRRRPPGRGRAPTRHAAREKRASAGDRLPDGRSCPWGTPSRGWLGLWARQGRCRGSPRRPLGVVGSPRGTRSMEHPGPGGHRNLSVTRRGTGLQNMPVIATTLRPRPLGAPIPAPKGPVNAFASAFFIGAVHEDDASLRCRASCGAKCRSRSSRSRRPLVL